MARIVVITGLSGSGKSTAIKALEDLGFYCVDNLPVTLMPKFAELCEESAEANKIGLGVDIRGGEFLKDFPAVLAQLREEGHDLSVIYLESEDDVLVKRFSETRRLHPLAPSGRVLEGIKKERPLLASLKNEASKIVDTSTCNVHQLKRIIVDHVTDLASSENMVLNLASFGFKYGILYEADIIMDARFLPNPNFIESMKDLTGEEKVVSDYVLTSEKGKAFMVRFAALLDFLIPQYMKEGKKYLTIAVGCTGGRHRSVAIIERLGLDFRDGDYTLKITHRDKDRHHL
ncbi:MAG: RNase adapter RapZ [Deltaproteobacteria bacterium]|nr:RNase adapter RapZ [Deltaproteobacteria bacterium]